MVEALFDRPGPRLFGLPPGADFPARLAAGLIRRMAGRPPEAMARVTLYLNTQRLRRRLREAFLTGGATFLPRMRLVTEIGAEPLPGEAGPPVSRLGRRLELAVLVDRLLTAQPDLAPRSALYDLADSLAALMDELRAESVPPARLAALDMEGHAAHWARARSFVSLVERFFGPDSPPDAEARLRRATETLIARWQAHPPNDPVIVAGSTGSRGTTALLMAAVARLPQGALVVPGFDFGQPAAVWQALDSGAAGTTGQEDHPQYRFHRLMGRIGIGPESVRPWDDRADDRAAPDPLRNALVSLALRPAPVTDQWIAEGPGLPDLRPLSQRLTLLEAPDPRAEAQAIALLLRGAVERGEKAVLLTPDRDLTRRVTAALDRWGLRPDDSAGQPLTHSPPGRLLRMIARAMGRRLAVDECLALMKHPLAFSGADRGLHLLLTRELELSLRQRGPAFPDPAALRHWAEARKEPLAPHWAERMGAILVGLADTAAATLPERIARHRNLAEALARGTDPGGSGALWERAAGAEALAAMDELAREAPEGFALSLKDYAALLDGVFSRRQVREVVSLDPRIEILGPQEARLAGGDLLVMAGLNEGVWPAQIPPDPWLNRRMRIEAGLLLPERRIGLSAHDFQMAIGAPDVVLSRALRDAEAETVPARWLNRLTNLMGGLSSNGGAEALSAMRARGQRLLAEAAAVERPVPVPAAPRPSPRPPLAARPARLSLTEVERLIRDPYAIYASHVLHLRPLPPLRPLADARLRGEVLHRVPERFLKQAPPPDPREAADLLMRITDEVLAEAVAWPAMRAVWRTRMAEIARPFVEGLRAAGGTPVSLERKYEVEIPGLDFRLVGKPDRLDLLDDGSLRIVDYKTGTPPSEKQQQAFAKQLHLAAVMAALGAFPEVGPQPSARLAYVALRRDMKEVASELGEEDVLRVLEEFRRLILAYRQPSRGYTARRAMVETRDFGDYDDLARYGEWDVTADPRPEDVG
ncbi:double-strand break repair protein AddB [Pseudogemmobacter sonorensis]|uniref:double-strand break repair protein AddB n=1 Tax=Pseudogemmobacter sonorensis TaxID=2989681 RepID=UPI0036903476